MQQEPMPSVGEAIGRGEMSGLLCMYSCTDKMPKQIEVSVYLYSLSCFHVYTSLTCIPGLHFPSPSFRICMFQSEASRSSEACLGDAYSHFCRNDAASIYILIHFDMTAL